MIKRLMLIMAALLCACGPVPVIERALQDDSDALFLKAEESFRHQLHDKALQGYQEYVNRFPAGKLAPDALMKIGAIHSSRENFSEARKSYQNLLDAYPASPLVPDAVVARLYTFHQQGQYKIVIEEAEKTALQAFPAPQLLRLLTLKGDSYAALGACPDAAVSYSQAYEMAQGAEKEIIASKLQSSVIQLSSPDIQSVLKVVKPPYVTGLLWYQLAINEAAQGRFDEASAWLRRLMDAAPDHPLAEDARRRAAEYAEPSRFDRRTVGCLLPLSGRYRVYGDQVLRGIQLALSRYGVLKNSEIKLLIQDTGSDPSKAAAGVQELVEQKAAAIIGPLVTAEAAAVEAQKSGIPIIVLTQKENIAEIGDYVFRNFLTPRMQVEQSVEYAIQTLGLKRFAILHPDEKYGKIFTGLFGDAVVAHGGSVCCVKAYAPDQTDFADVIKKLAGTTRQTPQRLKTGEPLQPADKTGDGSDAEKPTVDFDALFIPDAPKHVELILPQLAYHDVEGMYLIGTNLWHHPELAKTCQQFIQKAIIPDGFFPESQMPDVQEFVRIFEDTFGEKPGFVEAVSYDTAVMLFQLVHRGVDSRSALRRELISIRDFPGVTGKTSFTESGDALKKLYLLRVRGDRFVEISQP